MPLKNLRSILMRNEVVHTINESDLPETPQFVKDRLAAANRKYVREARKLNRANEQRLREQANGQTASEDTK